MRKDRGQRSEISGQIGQSREEFFTLRRGGAKGKDISKQQSFVGLSSRASISVPNLSGFASLRETSVTQGRPASARGSGLVRAGLHSKLAPFDSAQGKLGRKER